MDDSFPCRFCTVDGDKALQCEGRCTQWFHCRCIFGFELTLAHYKTLSLSKEEWRCANCYGNDSALILFNNVNAVDVFHFRIFQHQN